MLNKCAGKCFNSKTVQMNYSTVTECEFTVIPSDVPLSLKYICIHTHMHSNIISRLSRLLYFMTCSMRKMENESD